MPSGVYKGNKGRIAWNKGTKGLMSIPWNKGKKGTFKHTEEWKEQARKRITENNPMKRKEIKEKTSASLKKRYENPLQKRAE